MLQKPHRKRRRQACLGLAAACCAATAAGEPTVLPTLTVNAPPAIEHGAPDATTPTTVYRVDREQMRLFDTPGGSNPYTALAELPGVKISLVDAYGLNNMQGGQKGMRVRGEVSTHGVSGTFEGLALGGPGPGPGYLFLFDKENLAGIDFAQGAVAANRPGLFTTSGSLDSHLHWPAAQAGGELRYSAGTQNFSRLFGRADSGLLPSDTAFFVSASTTTADKWRGPGEAPGQRDNVELGIFQRLGDLKLRLAYAHNEQAQHNYKALTYTQARDLAHFGKADYGSDPASNDYYGYNRQDFTNEALLAIVEYAFSDDTVLTVKPYWAREQGYYLYAGSAAGQVQKWLIDHATWGLSSELRTRLAGTDLQLGYAWTSTAPPGPPTTREQYRIVGGQLVFQQWSLLSTMTERHEFATAYLNAERQFGDLRLQGGLRHASETLPAITAYNAGAATAGAAWDLTVDEALAKATVNPARSVASRSIEAWLPQAGAAWDLSEGVQLRASLGQNMGAPSFDAYNQTPAAGFTSQDYWNMLRPEIATSFDLGLRLRQADWYVDPTLYLSRSRNKAVSVYSPLTKTVWAQNVGNTEGWGAQLASGWQVARDLRLLAAWSYSHAAFRDDVQTVAGATLPVAGKQLPDVPTLMGNFGAVWQRGNYSVAPLVQYVGPRWATTDYSERIPAFVTVDVNFGYAEKGRWEAGLAVLNAFDRKYISQVSTSEVNTSANGAIYYPGAPRTLVATLGLHF